MRAWIFGLAGLTGCFGPPVPSGIVDDVAPKLCALGHPAARFQAASASSWSNGDMAAHQRYVDIAVHYTKGDKPDVKTMTVRVYVEQENPCKISLDVLSDDGPAPVLLDNGLASPGFGEKICKAMPK